MSNLSDYRQPAQSLARALYERRVLAAMAVLHEAEVTVRDKHGTAVLREAQERRAHAERRRERYLA